MLTILQIKLIFEREKEGERERNKSLFSSLSLLSTIYILSNVMMQLKLKADLLVPF